MVGRQNVDIYLQWVAMLLMLRTAGLDSYFLEIQGPRLRSDKWFPTPNSYLGVQTPKEGIPKLGVNFFIASVPDHLFISIRIETSYCIRIRQSSISYQLLLQFLFHSPNERLRLRRSKCKIMNNILFFRRNVEISSCVHPRTSLKTT